VCSFATKRIPRRASSVHIAEWPTLLSLQATGRAIELNENCFLCDAHHASLLAFLGGHESVQRASKVALRTAEQARLKEVEDLERAHGRELDELRQLPRADALRRIAQQHNDSLKLQRQLRDTTRAAEISRQMSEKKEAELREKLRRDLGFHRISWAKLWRLPQDARKDELCRALFVGFDWNTVRVSL
jgi:hypothetical protein